MLEYFSTIWKRQLKNLENYKFCKELVDDETCKETRMLLFHKLKEIQNFVEAVSIFAERVTLE